MSLSGAKDTVSNRLPDSGAVGEMRQSTPALYWLAICIGLFAFIGVLAFATMALLVLLITTLHVLAAAVAGDWLATVQWLAAATAATTLGAGVLWVGIRWVALHRGDR